MHVSIQVRDHLKDLLATGVASVAGRVSIGEPENPFSDADLPAIIVHSPRTRPSTSGKASGGTGIQSRVLEVPVLILAVENQDVEAELFEIAVEVEAAIFADGAWEDLDIEDVAFGGDAGVSTFSAQNETGPQSGLPLQFNITVATREGRADKPLRS